MEMISSIKDIPSTIREYKQIGNTKLGLCCIIIAALLCYKYLLYDVIKDSRFLPYDEFWVGALILFIVYMMWLIYSKRLFFRDQWYVLFWIGGFLLITAVYPYFVYPRFIKNSLSPTAGLYGTGVSIY